MSVGQSSETWHDNFGYEDGRRQFAMWSKRLSELQEIRSCAVAVEPTNNCERVAIGSRVTFEDTATGNRRTLRIGKLHEFFKCAGHNLVHSSASSYPSSGRPRARGVRSDQ